jgi:uncharacterized protein (TIGR02284 family)
MINDYEATEPITSDANPIPTAAADNTLSTDDVTACLNGLIETCRDGAEGFKSAAEGVDRSDLKTAFYEYSQQRAQFAAVLQELVRELGGDPESSGSVSGTIHRGWMDLKASITGGDEQSILNECERGEDHAKDAYRDALEKNLPANIADVVRQQSQSVQAAHNRVRELRNAEKGASATSLS